ncbi:DNA cytosine methyltransferase [Mycolicibacterium mucogenicum]|uniref:DNA (cytosine-5-)-methyltransferase n=1 Tax=Mycolicibacterium mucogenicum DSM 44124 TaxID=1226753 RepID=A0A8H2J8Z5_MYCMU|nr:DNA cytosine methyltransferase [Mycolicibacterium mucogenicum]KAB7761208.1 DNA methyltransferase [Mycolicibacterium mucogenicum DSM 44124]QPG70030.1 DNA cytosine methyltransferase [Mycolicibacterium mucogenicum DSM 44124]
MTLRIGSLFSGAGGLDLAAMRVFSGRIVWHSEIVWLVDDKGKSRPNAAVKVLEHRFPGVPNLGDISAVDWAAVDPIDILIGGFPCQDVSAAGLRAGMADGTRSGLWAVFAKAIAALRPKVVVIENVEGLLSAKAHRAMESDDAAVGDGSDGPVLRAAGAVLGDLAELGYDAQWTTVAASDVGAPHKRRRVFILATDTACDGRHEGGPEPAGLVGGPDVAVGGDADVALLPTPKASDGRRQDCPAERQRNTPSLVAIEHYLPTPAASDGTGGGQHPDRRDGHTRQLCDYALLNGSERWGKYAPAIERWEELTRPAPSPTEPNTNGNPRLAAAFSEWMQGWPAGWVTAVPGITRNDQLRMIGNGVCPQQAEYALYQLIPLAGLVLSLAPVCEVCELPGPCDCQSLMDAEVFAWIEDHYGKLMGARLLAIHRRVLINQDYSNLLPIDLDKVIQTIGHARACIKAGHEPIPRSTDDASAIQPAPTLNPVGMR